MQSSLDLLDVDVWLSLAVPDHAHHARAQRYWQEESAREVAFCRVTSLALVRHLMNPAVMLEAALTPAAAWQQYEAWRRMPGVVFLREPPGVEEVLGEICSARGFGSRGLADAYLAAFARAVPCRLVSFDGGFHRFPELDFQHLVP